MSKKKKNKNKRIRFVLFNSLFIIIFLCGGLYPGNSRADTIDELKQKIDDRNAAIKKLEAEIEAQKKDIDIVGKEKASLQSAVKTLDLTEKKILTDISATENKINVANLTIEKLGIEISKTETSINNSLASIAEILRNMNENDKETLLTSMLKYKDVSELWNEMANLDNVKNALHENMLNLVSYRTELKDKQDENEGKKKDLVGFKEDLSAKKKIVSNTKSEKATLLKTTQNKESEYQKALNEKIALKNAFEKELLSFESDLKIAIDPNSYSKPGQGILGYPLDSITVTQYFGDTAFARSGAYNGKGHNGVDFAASVGTPVKSAEDGIVKGSGNTDLVCPGASYGNWILVEHNNGLSTLYGHLSLIKSKPGDSVKRGEIIGYSGKTGYVTGPHLHFTVYATQGVQILSRKSAVCGGTYVMPVADLKAYLNPMLYL